MYKLLVRLHFDYCDVIFHNPMITNLFDSSINVTSLTQRLESTHNNNQHQQTWRLVRIRQNKLLEELCWETLSDRRWARRFFQYLKIFNNISADYLKMCLPPLRRYLYGVHINNVLQATWCRTNKYGNSFVPNSLKIWNNIGPEIRSIDSINIFKRL